MKTDCHSRHDPNQEMAALGGEKGAPPLQARQRIGFLGFWLAANMQGKLAMVPHKFN
jgi:hypothetical protein